MKNKYNIVTLIFCTLFSLPIFAGNVQQLPDVSLQSASSDKTSQTDNAQTTTFNQQQINDTPLNDVGELLEQEQSVAHLKSSSGDNTQTALSIRGFGDNAVANSLILLDGFPLTNPSLLAPNINAIPLMDIKRIRIFQGSQGSLWGDQAVGGVVSITTKHPKKFELKTMLSAGSFHRYAGNLLLGEKFKNGIFFKAFGLLSDTKNYRDHNQVSGDNLATTAGVDYASGSFLINLQKYENTTDFPGGLSQQQVDDDPEQATSLQNFSHYRTKSIQLLSKHAISDNWLLETRAWQSATDGDGKVFITFTRRDSTLAFAPRIKGQTGDITLISGYQGQVTRFRLSNIKVDSLTKARQQDVYAQITIPFNTALTVILGARAAMQSNDIAADINQPFNQTNKVFVSEQGIAYQATPALKVYLRRDGNFRFPKANEQISAANASESLRVQQGTSYETGLLWHYLKHSVQVNLYRLDLSKEIAFNPEQTASHPFGAWMNLDNTRRIGASVSDTMHINPKWRANLQLNYVNARFVAGDNAGKRIPAVPAVTANAGINYRHDDNWHVTYFLTYTGTRYASEDVSNIGSRLRSYLLNNAAIQYRKSNMLVSFTILNIANQNYIDYAYYNPTRQANIFYPAAGRNYLLTVRYDIA